MVHSVSTDLAGRRLILETGQLARQADAAVVVTYGDTKVLVTVGVTPHPIDADFLPLRVDFEERMYAVGRIPGGFFKREGRPSEEATLSCRKIDRPIRPLLPQGLRNDVQVIAMPLSAENLNSVELVALIGASAAMHLSSLPFDGPFGAAQVGLVDGVLTLNPSFEELQLSSLDLGVVATRKGIVMVELEGDAVPEADIVDAIKLGEESCALVADLIEELRQKAGKPKGNYPIWEPRPEIVEQMKSRAYDRICQASEILDKGERGVAFDQIVDELVEQLEPEYPRCSRDIKAILEGTIKKHMQQVVLDDHRRTDGRGLKEIRPISCEVGMLARAHGSGLFTRGETQVMSITTLGATRDQRMVRTLEEEDYTRFMHHYNFPPFCVGEVRALRGPGRREIGHGHLAQSALAAVLPPAEEFPYTIRLVSEVLESNGSSSMASVCASSLSLMDAGVPIREPVAGVSVGLIYEGPQRYVILTDIQGLEDQSGHMDFKVAGTRAGINALHLDMKVQGLPSEVLTEALAQAREARLEVLDKMEQALAHPRTELSAHAPRMFAVKIDPSKIGMVIGPGGKNIRGLEAEHEVQIDIEEDGTVLVFGKDSEKAEACRQAIADMTREITVGEVFKGKVVSIQPFGAFVQLLPGQDGLLHISEMAWERVAKTEDVAKLGDEIEVKVIGVETDGKVRLSRRELIPRPPGVEAPDRDRERSSRGGGGGGRGRGGDSGRDRSQPYMRDKKS